MTTLEILKSRLQACKGSGAWKGAAAIAGCHYFTVARIARGALANPGSLLVDRLLAALDQVAPASQDATAAMET